jgi:hypothetical protein
MTHFLNSLHHWLIASLILPMPQIKLKTGNLPMEYALAVSDSALPVRDASAQMRFHR